MNYNFLLKVSEIKMFMLKSFNCDKLRISMILTIISNGSKLPLLVVFKGKAEGPLEK